MHKSFLTTILLTWITYNTSNDPQTCTSEECKDCRDNNEKCQQFASSGDCTKNPKWMLEHCKVSCHACPRSKDDAMPSYEEAEEIYGPLDDYDDEDMQELDDLALRLEKYGVPQSKSNSLYAIIITKTI